MKKGLFMGRSLAHLSVGLLAGGAMSAMGRCHNYLSASDMEEQANGLSNYAGMDNYTGAGDAFLDFAGGGSFADPISKGKIFNLTIKNNDTANMRTALLCPGLIPNTAGLIADGAFNDANGGTGLQASGSPQSIALFNRYIQLNPTLVAGFKVSCSNVAQFDQNMAIVKQSPFKSHESKIINVSIYASEANPNTTLITVPEPFFMDYQTQVSYPIMPSTTVNIGLIFGTSLNQAQALKNKTATAKGNLIR